MTTDWKPLEYANQELNCLALLAASEFMTGTVDSLVRFELKQATRKNERNYGIKWAAQENRDNA